MLIWIVLAIIVWGVVPAMQEKKRIQRVAEMQADAVRRLVRGIAGMLAKMAKADGHVSAEEVEVAQSILRAMGLSASDYSLAVNPKIGS